MNTPNLLKPFPPSAPISHVPEEVQKVAAGGILFRILSWLARLAWGVIR